MQACALLCGAGYFLILGNVVCFFGKSSKNYRLWGELSLVLKVEILHVFLDFRLESHKQIIDSQLCPRKQVNKFKPLHTHDLFTNWQVLSTCETSPGSPLSYTRTTEVQNPPGSALCLHPLPSLTGTRLLAFVCRSGCRQEVETTLHMLNRGNLLQGIDDTDVFLLY